MGRRGRNVVIVGASVAGSLVARVLSDHFDNVVLIDKDRMPIAPSPRRYVPQERHLHLVLQRGQLIIEKLYPGFWQECQRRGACYVDVSKDIRWLQGKLWRGRWSTGIGVYHCSRTLVEWLIRQRTRSLKNVEIMDSCTLKRISFNSKTNSVEGIWIDKGDGFWEQLSADLVIDATGQGTQTPKWLKDTGIGTVSTEFVNSNVGYVTRTYRRDPAYSNQWKALLITPGPPTDRRIAVICPIEPGLWLVTAGGRLGAFPKADPSEFLAFLKALPVPDAYEAIRHAKPLSQPERYVMRSSIRRRYDLINNWPTNFLVVGDAVCSINPAFSQGISICAMQAEILGMEVGQWLVGNVEASEIQRTIFESTQQPWKQSASADQLYPELAPTITAKGWLKKTYMRAAVRASASDKTVLTKLLRVHNLLEDGSDVFQVNFALKVVRAETKRILMLLERAIVNQY